MFLFKLAIEEKSNTSLVPVANQNLPDCLVSENITMQCIPVSVISNSSSITAIANDYNYKKIFSRQLEAIGINGDVLFCFTTSGLSLNVIEAIKIAQKKQINIVVFTGKMKNYLSKFKGLKIVKVPSKVTARIQEMHILIGHIICEIIESVNFKKQIYKY